MKLYNLYVANVIFPTGLTMHNELKTVKTKIVSKEGDKYRDLVSGSYYTVRSIVGTIRICGLTPLSDYYNVLGLKKKNNHRNQEIVYEKVRILRKEKKL